MREGIIVRGMSQFQLVRRETHEVVFGCAGFEPGTIAAAVARIRRAVGSA
jgi:hypothetical protein